MVYLHDITKSLRVAVDGPLGQRSKTQIVSRALPAIRHLRSEGYTFHQIAGTINSLIPLGMTTFSADELRGLFYRQQKRLPPPSGAMRDSQKAAISVFSPPQNSAPQPPVDLKHKRNLEARSTIEQAQEKLRRTQKLREI